MWKDLFYFTKAQRIGIIFLLILIIFALILFAVLPLIVVKKENNLYKNADFISKASSFKQQLVLRDSLWQEQWNNQRFSDYSFRKDAPSETVKSYKLFVFNPNKADSVDLCRLGLKGYVVTNILRYRKKGGYFKDPESFSKVYGISAEKYNELRPYIEITAETTSRFKDSVISKTPTKSDNLVLDLNSADTAELVKIKGIGRVYAKNIVRYRQLLGGYVKLEQLKEVYGISDEIFDKIKSHFTVNPQQISYIIVNTASVDKLRKNPYLDFYQAKAIYELRRKRIKLKSVDDLRILPELTPDDIKKIEPYFSFQ